MKLVIELEDQYIRRLVSEQIGAHISALSKDVIEARIKEVLFNVSENIDAKLNATTEQTIKAALVEKMRYYRLDDKITIVLREMLKEKFK